MIFGFYMLLTKKFIYVIKYSIYCAEDTYQMSLEQLF